MKKSKKLCAILLTGSLLFSHGMVANAALPDQDKEMEDAINKAINDNTNFPDHVQFLFAYNGGVAGLFTEVVSPLEERILSLLNEGKLTAEVRTTLNEMLSKIKNARSELKKMLRELYVEIPKKENKEAAYAAYWEKLKKMSEELQGLISEGQSVMAVVGIQNSLIPEDAVLSPSIRFVIDFDSGRYTEI